jgi:hypothetical protein
MEKEIKQIGTIDDVDIYHCPYMPITTLTFGFNNHRPHTITPDDLTWPEGLHFSDVKFIIGGCDMLSVYEESMKNLLETLKKL